MNQVKGQIYKNKCADLQLQHHNSKSNIVLEQIHYVGIIIGQSCGIKSQVA